jgi:hypothetical protein
MRIDREFSAIWCCRTGGCCARFPQHRCSESSGRLLPRNRRIVASCACWSKPICRCPACGAASRHAARAIELFSQLRVWDTEQNSGVLIYLQLIDRRVEIVADRGIDACVGQEFWDRVCRHMENAFRSRGFRGRYAAGALRTITAALALNTSLRTGEKRQRVAQCAAGAVI